MSRAPSRIAALRQPTAAPARRGARFVLLSGLGWVLDTGVFMALVVSGLAGVMVANVLGGACGATFAFLTSNRWVFGGRRRYLTARLVVYLAYTVALILLASALVDLVARLLDAALAWLALDVAHAVVAFGAKCIVTPFTLGANFLVARFLLDANARGHARADHD